MAVETTVAETWLYGLLAADTGVGGVNHATTGVNGRIYSYVAPEGAEFPFVIVSHQSGHDVRGTGPARVMAAMVYQVKVVGKARSQLAIAALASRVDALLQGASGTVSGGQVLACVREQTVSYLEVDAGTQYRHLGGLYRIWAR